MSKISIVVIFLLLTGRDLFVYKPHGTHYVELSRVPQKLDISWNQSSDTLGIWG